MLSHIVLALGIFCFLYKLLRALFSPLKRVPGPFFARFSRAWYFREAYHGRVHSTTIRLHEKYGSVVRISPNEFSIDDPQAVQLIYGSKGGFTKGPWYLASVVPGTLGHSVFADSSIERHARNRRRISHAYSMTNMIGLEPFLNDCTSLLLARLEEMATAATLVDIPHWMQCYAFDVIGAITVGQRFGFLDAGVDIEGIMESLTKSLNYAVRVGIYYEWHPILFYLNAILAPGMKGLIYTFNFIQKHIDARLNHPLPLSKIDDKSPTDFVTKFLLLKEVSPEKVDRKDIESAAFNNFGAGSDTTSIGLCAAIFFLCQYPVTFAKLRKELDAATKCGSLSEPVTYKQALTLPYLQAVIKESLRCHPPAGLSMSRVVPAGGAEIAGHFFPPGTVVGINAWVAHANKSVFGQDADIFRPERWLENPEVVKERDAYFLSFGSGTRTCLGKNISLLEMSKLIPTLVKNYDFESEHPGQPPVTENDWFVKQKDFRCRITPRWAKI